MEAFLHSKYYLFDIRDTEAPQNLLLTSSSLANTSSHNFGKNSLTYAKA